MRDDNTAKIPFSNIVSNLNIEGYSNWDPLAINIRDPVLKCIVKYRNHPSILAIGEVFQRPLFFSKIQRDEVLSDILKLETSRASQDTDIPTKIVKENADIFVIVLVFGFRKVYNTQYFLLAMLGKWKSAVDKGKWFGALLTDLSKELNCLSHKLVLAKLHAHGFSIAALKLIHSYLTNTRQRIRINMSYSSSEEIVFRVPQGSILGPLLFNIFLCDLFFIMKDTDFSSYADDNTQYRTAGTIEEIIKLLERDSMMLFKWFSDNQMKANISKYHLLVNKKHEVVINLGEMETEISEYEKLLGTRSYHSFPTPF